MRHLYQFTKLNKYFIFKLADVFVLDYINQTDVFQMITVFPPVICAPAYFAQPNF